MKNIVIQIICFLIILNLNTSCEKKKKGIDCSLGYGTLVDPRDGSRYSTLAVCDVVWITQNLRYEMPGVLKEPIDLGVEYGFLYNFEQAQSACPENWHLATDKDWKTLETVLGMPEDELDKTGWRGEEVGQSLKTSIEWEKGTKSSTPISFRALPAGYSNGTQQGLEETARFWTASEADTETAWIRELGLEKKKIKRSTEKKSDYNSCRCVLN
jgi:uncharacterized protein (TIGR02145 family)